MINIKNLDPNKIKIDEKSYKNILIEHIGNVTIKDLSYAAVNSVNLLYLTINKMNGYIEENNRNKYSILVPAVERKEKLKKYEELWDKIKDLSRSIANNSDNFDEKWTKIKFNLDDHLPLNKTLKLYNTVIVV